MQENIEGITLKHRLNENGFPEDYISFITLEDARHIVAKDRDERKRLKAIGVLNAYNKLELYRRKFFMPLSIQYQLPDDIKRDLHEIGFCSAIIWSFNKTPDEMMEMMNILDYSLQEAINQDLDKDNEVFLDISDPKSELCKLFGILRLTDIQDIGVIFIDEYEQLANIKLNLMNLRDGMIHYFKQLPLLYSWV